MSINRGINRIIKVFLWILVLTVIIILCQRRGTNDQTMIEPVYSYKIVAAYPHDSSAFTQGLAHHNNLLYEGTGLYGHSSLRQSAATG